MTRPRIPEALCVLALLTTGVARAENAPPPRQSEPPSSAKVEPCAADELAKMSGFLAQQRQFTVRTARTLDQMQNGKRTTLKGSGTVALQRPDKLRVERQGEMGGSGTAYYDGKTFSVIQKGAKYYATAAAPDTVDDLMDQTEEALGWIPPGADLLSSNPAQVLEEHVVSGRCLGDGKIGGVTVKRLAFEGPDAKWEIAIEDSATPLPRELVIMPKDDPQTIRYALTLSDWNLAPKLAPSFFEFTPPKGAERVSFLLAQPRPQQQPGPAQGRKGAQP